MKINKTTQTNNTELGFRYLLVSLFLAVLAFFIVLNSIAQINKNKTKKFFTEVQDNFVGDDLISKLKLNESNKPSAGQNSDIINIKDSIYQFLVNKSMLVVSDFTDHGRLLEIKITMGNIFNSNSSFPKTSATKFFREFSEFLVEQRILHQFKLSLISGYDQNADEYNDNNFKLSTKRNHTILNKFKFNLNNKVNINSYLIPYNNSNKNLSFMKIIIYLDES